MKLHDILKGSDYSLDLFVQESINALENRIIDKVDKKGKPYYSVNCIIRGKEIKLTPEEVVRQIYTEQLISQYGYAKDRIAFEYPIYFGREAKRADIVIRDADDANVAYIIVEVKKPKAKDGQETMADRVLQGKDKKEISTQQERARQLAKENEERAKEIAKQKNYNTRDLAKAIAKQSVKKTTKVTEAEK